LGLRGGESGERRGKSEMERAQRRERWKEESEMGFVGGSGSGGMGTCTEAWADGRGIHTQRIHYVTLTVTSLLLLLLLLRLLPPYSTAKTNHGDDILECEHYTRASDILY